MGRAWVVVSGAWFAGCLTIPDPPVECEAGEVQRDPGDEYVVWLPAANATEQFVIAGPGGEPPS